MANIIKIKRGLSTNIPNVSLEQGELAITTDTNELYVGTEAGKEKLTGGGMDAINIVADSSITTEKTGKVDIASIFTGTETKTYTIKGTTNLEQAVIYCGAGTVKNMMSEPQEDLTAPSGATIIYTNKSGFLMSKYGIYLLVYDEQNSMCFGVPYDQSTLYGFSEHKYEMVPCTITNDTLGFTYDEAARTFTAIGGFTKHYKTTLTMTGNAYSTHIIVRPNQQNEHGTIKLEKISNGQSTIITETSGFISEYITVDLETGDKLVMTYDGNLGATSDENVEIFFSYYQGEEQHTTATLFYINNLLDDIHFQLEANAAAAQRLDWEKEWRSNKVKYIESTSTDEQYPTAKAVYEFRKPTIKAGINSTLSIIAGEQAVSFPVVLYNNTTTSTLQVLNGNIHVGEAPGYARLNLNLGGTFSRASTSIGETATITVYVQKDFNGISENIIIREYTIRSSDKRWEINLQDDVIYDENDQFTVIIDSDKISGQAIELDRGEFSCSILERGGTPNERLINVKINPDGAVPPDEAYSIYKNKDFTELLTSGTDTTFTWSYTESAGIGYPVMYLKIWCALTSPTPKFQTGCCATHVGENTYAIALNAENSAIEFY